MKIKSISMKEVIGGETYYRMWVNASELPEWMYLKAKEMDDGCDSLSLRDTQCFEIEGYISSIDDKATELKLVYFWNDYKTITELDENYHRYIYEAFEEFASKHGSGMPDNRELLLGDGEYEDLIPQELKDEGE